MGKDRISAKVRAITNPNEGLVAKNEVLWCSLDRYVSSVKAVLVKAPSRRQNLQDALQAAGKLRVLPPVPVITRWATWLKAVSYHSANFEEEKLWISTAEEDSAAVTELKNLIEDPELELQMNAVITVSEALQNSIAKFESRDTLVSEVWLTLSSLKIQLESNNLPSEKLRIYMEGRHPCAAIWKQVQKLDPTRCTHRFGMQFPEELKSFSSSIIPNQEIATYSALLEEQLLNINASTFWKRHEQDMPQLSALARKALAVPCNNAEVERSFSLMNRILVPQRTSLTEENLGIHMRIGYNTIQVQKEVEDIEEDD